MPARYHLRFQIHAGPAPTRVAADATELAGVCAEAGVSEVVLLTGAEEAFAGHPTGPAEDAWFEAAATARQILADAGLAVSLNPWVTVGHADRGRHGTLDRLGFAPMVSPTGQVAAAQASFACPQWRAWLLAHYGRFAELGFRVLWLEDDFRYHNHAPLEWGGGFEPLMLDRFAALSGQAVGRAELVAAVTAPGPPHPWRAQLQQVWRDAQVEVAAALAAEVALRSGGRSTLGLMSSGLDAHSVEGRDWPALFDALAIRGRVAHRPHFAPYSDTPGRELSRQLWSLELQRALRPGAARSEPEIENWPHTAWSKSDTQTWSELAAAQLAGSHALLLNLHPMNTRRAARHPQVTALLRRSRPALDWLADRYGDQAATTAGVGLAVRPDAATHAHSTRATLTALAAAADPAPVADWLLRYGVPVTADPAAPVQALFGQHAHAFTDDRLRALLGEGLLLDGTAAEILVRRGHGPLIGLTDAVLVSREQSDGDQVYAEEHVLDGGVPLSVNVQPALARLAPAPGAQVWTEIRTPDGLPWGPGRTAFTNPLGGRAAVLAATALELLPCDDTGQRLLHRAVRYAEGERPALPLVTGGPLLIPHLSHTDGATRLAIANGSADPARVRLRLPHAAPTDPEATLLAPLTAPTPVELRRHGAELALAASLPHRGWLVVEW
ncbi:hypothetical protein CFP65_0015 [Kitasatospora sp. MMS16-BH015]|uniref:hypothetical protein n=1 Tax=Kitasatospora sp. MMS16-BH015 TaxID=2018025 RepID=UPI000CA106F3|nr:hypothetical protein [Kitasatospora sp. MMS16-BH015]AUG75003.1 hypothetical protein CFP65_0015 [Kitasatospora sp. MMS16-BH015]